jgi:hypothetical protein
MVVYLQRLGSAEENWIRHAKDLIIWDAKQETAGSHRT